ncbi:MAG: DUF4261 domain-containing protein [Saprospiraceae bacterium]|nr:DUF4261 domain-containing protein [Saprospiraceae bacterium]
MRFFILVAALLAVFSKNIIAQKLEQKVVSGIVLLNDKTAPDAQKILAALRKDWKLKTDSVNVGEKTVVFVGPGAATVMVAFLDYPAPAADVATAARLSWLWKSGAEEALRHQSQVLISVVGTENKTLDLYKLFTAVVAGVMEQTNACGVYMADQYLLLSKGFYVAAAQNMRDHQTLPVYCWVYFGMKQEGEQSGAFTWGLQELGFTEMEIVNAPQSLSEVHSVLYDAAQTVIQYNLKLQDGQKFTTVEGQTLTAKRSVGAYQEGDTFKLGY